MDFFDKLGNFNHPLSFLGDTGNKYNVQAMTMERCLNEEHVVFL